MLPRSLNREFAFILNDVARMLRTYADYKASQFGITRAQWVVLVRLDRFEGLKQSELAEMLDLQPITLTRLLDRLCECGLIERRARSQRSPRQAAVPDPEARPLLERSGDLGEELMATALAGVERENVEMMVDAACHREREPAPGDPAKECSAQRGGRAALWLSVLSNPSRSADEAPDDAVNRSARIAAGWRPGRRLRAVIGPQKRRA